MFNRLDIICGGQFGSEGKGHVTKRVIQRRLMESRDGVGRFLYNVRVAGPNAGHCVWDDRGNKFPFRTVPVGVVYPSVRLHIAPGSEVEPAVLFEEVELAVSAGHRVAGRFTVSPEATILTDEHKVAETGMHERMGSTGKGIGACRADRIMRTAKRVGDDPALVREMARYGIEVRDVQMHTHDVVIEGTQGYGLGLHAGYYPQCTSSDTRAIDFAAMAGVNPWDAIHFTPWVVARVYPIRVAGNSGPLKNERTWEELGLPEERTTVTKKVRRVGEWDGDLVKAAIAANGKSRVRLAITMVDQKFGFMQGINADEGTELPINDEQWRQLRDYLAEVRTDVQHDINLITTGEDTGVWL